MSIYEHIKGFQPISLCDWPSKVCSVLFMGGCNFRCPTCHNKNIAFYPEKIATIPEKDIFDYLAVRKKWIDGVVISGGEPTISTGLDRLILDIRELGFKIKLDTNGSNPDVVEELLKRGLVDLFAVDVKGPFEKYPELTGNKISEKEIKINLDKIFYLASKYPSNFLFRLTKVPLLTKEDIHKTKNYLPQGFKLILQEYMEVN